MSDNKNVEMVPLADVMIAWNQAGSLCPRGGEPGQIGVCRHPAKGQLRHLSRWVKPSFNLPEGGDKLALLMLQLMLEAWHIACRDGVPLANIHGALSAVPEYNDRLSDDFRVYAPPAEASLWIPVSERMPAVNRKVWVCGGFSQGGRYQAAAVWTDGLSWDATAWDEVPDDWWDEEQDVARVPAGWWEHSVEIDTVCPLDGVTHWMPRPAWPEAKTHDEEE